MNSQINNVGMRRNREGIPAKSRQSRYLCRVFTVTHENGDLGQIWAPRISGTADAGRQLARTAEHMPRKISDIARKPLLISQPPRMAFPPRLFNAVFL